MFLVHRSIKFPWTRRMDVYRCNTCERVATDSQKSLEQHVGHYMKQPCNLGFFEMIGLMVGLIK